MSIAQQQVGAGNARLQERFTLWELLFLKAVETPADIWIDDPGVALSTPMDLDWTYTVKTAAGSVIPTPGQPFQVTVPLNFSNSRFEPFNGSIDPNFTGGGSTQMQGEILTLTSTALIAQAMAGLDGFSTSAQMAANDFKRIPARYGAAALHNGENTTCPFDGGSVKFFAASGKKFDPKGGGSIGTYGNYRTNFDLTDANFQTVTGELQTRVQPNGNPYNFGHTAQSLVLLTPPGPNAEKARNILGKQLTTSVAGGTGGSVAMYERGIHRIANELPNPKDWYVYDNSLPERAPLVVARPKAPFIVPRDLNSHWVEKGMVGLVCLTVGGAGLGYPVAITKCRTP